MLDHTNDIDHTAEPGYVCADEMVLTDPAQFKAIVGSIRPRILGLLSERAATTQQIAATLGLSKGTTGHHLKVLEAAGLIHMVRRRQVRAVPEKYYGRGARLYRISTDECAPGVSGLAVPREVLIDP